MKQHTILFLALWMPLMFGCQTLQPVSESAFPKFKIEKDSVVKVFSGTPEILYPKAMEAVRFRGVVTKQYKELGEFEALIENINVRVRIQSVSDSSSQIKVSARKDLIPQIKTAENILTVIASQIK